MCTLRVSIRTILINSALLLLLSTNVQSFYRQKTVYQKITTDPSFSQFSALVQNSSLVKRAVLYWNTTVFAPKDEAFEKFKGFFSLDLAYYHVSNELKSMRMIFESNNMQTLADQYPPLWISKIDGNIFINNAKIITKDSDYFSRAAGGYYNHNQALHVIDEVLEPPSRYLDSPTAFDLIANFTQEKILRTKKYFKRINDLNMSKLFKLHGGNTYFVPLDVGFNDFRYRMIDKYFVEGHIVPNQVLFTKPTLRNFYFETKANGDYIYILVSFVERNGRLYVRSNTILGDSNHQRGEFLSAVTRANVPVKNGVVHFIERPLAIFDMQLKPFPYLPILSKLSGDPELSVTFELGRKTDFNEHLKNSHSLLTFFVPRDKAWMDIGLMPNSTDDQVKFLGRHLVISDVRYTMQKLWYRSFDRIVTLNTVGGPVDVKIVKDENDNYSIMYDDRFIKVYRPDYMCTNGIIHIIDEPFVAKEKGNRSSSLRMDFWKSLEDFVF